MRKRFWSLAHVGLTLACVACCVYLLWRDRAREGERARVAGRLSADADPILRLFHQVRWIGGDYELPAGEDHCGIAVLTFENGRFTGRHHPWAWSVPPGEPRAIPYQVVWGPTAAGPKTLIVGGGIGMSGGTRDFTSLDGMVGRSYGTSNLGEVRGYRVVGLAGSMEARANSPTDNEKAGAIHDALRTHRHVAALGVKIFPTAEDAKQWAHGATEKPDP
jgi:hypothetical protein